MNRRPRFTAVALVALALALPGPVWGAQHEKAAWDQEAVTALARQLADDMKGIRQAFRNEPPPTIVSGESRARYRLLDILRRIESETRHLANELADGRGHDETLPVFENLLTLVRDAQEERRRIFLQSETLARVGSARAHLEQLDPYYDQKAPLPKPVDQPGAE